MSKKIAFHGHSTQTYAEVFQIFITAKTAEGVADITIAKPIVDGFDRCFYAVLCEELLNGISVLGMLLGGVMV